MTKYEKRCADCAECKKVKGVLVCADAWDKPINEIDECTLGIELEEVENLETIRVKMPKAKATKSVSQEKRKLIPKKCQLLRKSLVILPKMVTKTSKLPMNQRLLSSILVKITINWTW